MSLHIDAALDLTTSCAVFPVNVYSEHGTTVKVPAISNALATKENWLVEGKGGYYLASQSCERVRAMWEAAGDKAVAIGVATGASGLVVVDDDTPKKDDPDAEAWFERFADELSKTRTHRTVSGGRHFIFKAPKGRGIKSQKTFDAVDIRGTSGYVVYPPSLGYSIENDVDPQVMSQEMERTIRDHQRTYKRAGAAKTGSDAPDEALVEAIRTGTDFHDATLELTNRWGKAGVSKERRAELILAIYDSADAAETSHPENARWASRRRDAVRTSNGASRPTIETDEAGEGLADFASLPDLGLGKLFKGTTHEGPAPVTKPKKKTPQAKEKTSTSDLEVADGHVIKPLEEHPPRPWLMQGVLLRKYVSLLFGAGGGGKTSLALAWAVSLATGRHLEGFPEPSQEEGVRVLFWCEDPQDEIDRRVDATCMQYGITQAQIRGKLFTLSKRDCPLNVAYIDEDGVAVGSPDVMRDLVTANEIDVLILDPLIEIFEGLEENNAGHMRAVMSALADVADYGAAVLALHHTAKAGSERESTADNARGSTAIINSARVAIEVKPMAKTEADKLGIEDDDRGLYVKATIPKSNMAKRHFVADYYKLEIQSFNNARDGYAADEVAVTVPWTPTIEPEWSENSIADLVDAFGIIERLSEPYEDDEGEEHEKGQTDRRRWSGQADLWLGWELGRFWGLDMGHGLNTNTRTSGQREAHFRVLKALNALEKLQVIFKDAEGYKTANGKPSSIWSLTKDADDRMDIIRRDPDAVLDGRLTKPAGP